MFEVTEGVRKRVFFIKVLSGGQTSGGVLVGRETPSCQLSFLRWFLCVCEVNKIEHSQHQAWKQVSLVAEDKTLLKMLLARKELSTVHGFRVQAGRSSC
jgi:hypothetical protein